MIVIHATLENWWFVSQSNVFVKGTTHSGKFYATWNWKSMVSRTHIYSLQRVIPAA